MTHNLKGSDYKSLRLKLLDIAHRQEEEGITEVEAQMLTILPKKVATFKESSIKINYLHADMDDIAQAALEMMLPVPNWAQEFIRIQRDETVELVFGRTYDLTIDTNLVLGRKGKGKKRKRYFD